MLDLETAKQRVVAWINARYEGDFRPVVVLDEYTMERPYGWVFYYNTQLYRDTRDFRYALAGNGPVVVEKSDGSMQTLGTQRSVEVSLEEYELEKGHRRPD